MKKQEMRIFACGAEPRSDQNGIADRINEKLKSSHVLSKGKTFFKCPLQLLQPTELTADEPVESADDAKRSGSVRQQHLEKRGENNEDEATRQTGTQRIEKRPETDLEATNAKIDESAKK